MDVTTLHQAKHFTRVAADVQRLPVKLAGERVQRRHDISDGPIAVVGRVRRCGLLRFVPDLWICLLHHLLAKVHTNQVVLEDIVIEHVLSGFTQIGNPFGHGGRLDPVGHVCA